MTVKKPNLANLPADFVIRLPQVSAIRLHGEEQSSYLQGQVTCDVKQHSEESLTIGAHCDAKGKVLSVFRLFSHQGAFLLAQVKSSIDRSLAELSKFGVFAKVDIEQASDVHFACLQGENSSTILTSKGIKLPTETNKVTANDELTIVCLDANQNRFLLAGTESVINDLVSSIDVPELSESVWSLLELSTGAPLLSESTVAQYVPQMINIDKLDGISFTKGCYIGQETVARMQYLGKNKKMMALFTGNVEHLPESVSHLEKQLGENWRSAGEILHYYHADDGTIYLQAVVANDLTTDNKVRLKGSELAALSLTPVTYPSA